MALTDPQSVTIGAATISVPRTNTGNNSSEYTSADGLTKLTISHALGRRTRRVVRIDHSKISADPFRPSENVKLSMSCYMVIDTPAAGLTNAQILEVYEALELLLTANSSAIPAKVVGGES